MKNIVRNLLVMVLVAFSVAACGPSPEKLYQQGVDYYNNQDYSKAEECFRKAAEKGHAEAEKYLAMLLENAAEQTDAEGQPAEGTQEEGAESQLVFNGVGFSVSATDVVYFAPSNLQYQASTKGWRLAEKPWVVLGEINSNISDENAEWIDLFGWGTGSNPTQDATNNNEYESFVDWGNNNILNGGGRSWRTLTKDEWTYVFDERNTPSGLRYAKATVNDVKGVILLPDDWNSEYYELNNTNKSGEGFDGNIITDSDWANVFGAKGAVFLPNTGVRKSNSVSSITESGYYWSSTNYDNTGSFAVLINDSNINAAHHYYQKNGFAVRLVCAAK